METVAVLLAGTVPPFFISIPKMIFEDLPPEGSKRKTVLCAERPGRVPVDGGLWAEVSAGLEALQEAPLAVIPWWPEPERAPSGEVIAALRSAHARGCRLVGLCRGGFALAHAGLLDGLPAATHWRDAEAFKRLFPRVKLDPRVLYAEGGGITTSAGIAAGIDCCLHVLRELEGAAVANEVARLMVAPPFREGGQAQFIERAVPVRTADERINRLIAELTERIAEDVPLEELAARAAMSPRTFFRAFRRATGLAPRAWITQARLRAAQEMLETGSGSVESIAKRCGFDSPVTFRQRFRELYGVSPSAWRQTFGNRSAV